MYISFCYKMLSRAFIAPEFTQCVTSLLPQITAKTQYGCLEEIDAIPIQLKLCVTSLFIKHPFPQSSPATSSQSSDAFKLSNYYPSQCTMCNNKVGILIQLLLWSSGLTSCSNAISLQRTNYPNRAIPVSLTSYFL